MHRPREEPSEISFGEEVLEAGERLMVRIRLAPHREAHAHHGRRIMEDGLVVRERQAPRVITAQDPHSSRILVDVHAGGASRISARAHR